MSFVKNRKFVLFFLQFLIVFAFVIFGAFLNNNVIDSEPWSVGNVKFLTKSSTLPSQKIQQYSTPTFMKIVKNDPFHRHFVTIQEKVSISSVNSEQAQIRKTCFKEGTRQLNDSHRASHVNNKTNDYDSPACLCLPEWHGHACSEPEIIWRAFMGSRQPMNHPPEFTRHPHNVFYVIKGVTSINLETLEIQILELFDVVNLFVLCDVMGTENTSLSMQHQMNKGVLLLYKDQLLLLNDESCTSSRIYRKIKEILKTQIRQLDVIIFGNSDEIINKKAVNYLKWHNSWHQPLRFRLRWNVYGFFFQHPDYTIISSSACQVNVLEQFLKSDSGMFSTNHHSSTVMVVGDLNHYGGWFCEYCHQPMDIIKKLHLDSKRLANKSTNLFEETYHRKPTINIDYIQNLIQNGLYINGKLELLKLRHYKDSKYFTPETVAKNRGKFDNIVTNYYSSWDDGLDDY